MDKMNTYLNFVYNAIRGGDPVGTTQFLKDNLDDILEVADGFYKNWNRQTIYRGLVLPKQSTKYLQPDKRWLYVSFSEDINVALHFADPSPSGFGAGLFGNALGDYGYITELSPESNYRILFHWSFVFHPKIKSLFERVMTEDDFNLVNNQKEVCILQPDKPLKLELVYGKK